MSIDCDRFVLIKIRADIWLSIFSMSKIGCIFFIIPNPFILLNLASTVGVLTLISLAICLNDFLPSCINDFIIAMSVLSSLVSKQGFMSINDIPCINRYEWVNIMMQFQLQNRKSIKLLFHQCKF